MNNTARAPNRPIPTRPAPPSQKPTQKTQNAFHQANTSPPTAEQYTPEEERRIQTLLNKVLGPEYVSFRPGGGGQNVSYIEGWKALNLANEVFGFNGWSSQVISVQVDFMDSLGLGRVSLGLSVVVRITIRDGTFHEDIGYGFIENAKGKAVAFEKCKKEAFTDGLKRCLRCFGNVLGNCLYDKGIVAKMQKVKLPVPELQPEDFHRDPLVVKRETERATREIQKRNGNQGGNQGYSAQGSTSNGDMHGKGPSTGTSSSNGTSTSNGTSDGNVTKGTRENNEDGNLSASARDAVRAVKDYDLEDFDELFEFSDDLPGEGIEPSDQLDDYDMDLNEKRLEKPDEKAPEQVFFTSSKKAMDLQKDPEQGNIPVYDHKFVASSVKRTVDPFKSQKVRRADLPSQAGRIASPLTNSVGKRPLGMPPSQRQQPKRLHKDGEEA